MEKWAIVTGASSGIGEQLARLYAAKGYCIVLTARRTERLCFLADELDTGVLVVPADLNEAEGCRYLYEKTHRLNVELLINCAGFGAVGKFEQIDLDRQLDMIKVNCTAVTALTHMFLKDFKYRDKGRILNVASSAGLLPGGPNMAVYYATKSYVVSLTNAISEELRSAGSRVQVAALCPGPVDTEFNDQAGVKFALSGISAKYCAKCAAYGLDRGETIIIPEEKMKLLTTLSRFIPRRISLFITGIQQKKKM